MSSSTEAKATMDVTSKPSKETVIVETAPVTKEKQPPRVKQESNTATKSSTTVTATASASAAVAASKADDKNAASASSRSRSKYSHYPAYPPHPSKHAAYASHHHHHAYYDYYRKHGPHAHGHAAYAPPHHHHHRHAAYPPSSYDHYRGATVPRYYPPSTKSSSSSATTSTTTSTTATTTNKKDGTQTKTTQTATSSSKISTSALTISHKPTHKESVKVKVEVPTQNVAPPASFAASAKPTGSTSTTTTATTATAATSNKRTYDETKLSVAPYTHILHNSNQRPKKMLCVDSRGRILYKVPTARELERTQRAENQRKRGFYKYLGPTLPSPPPAKNVVSEAVQALIDEQERAAALKMQKMHLEEQALAKKQKERLQQEKSELAATETMKPAAAKPALVEQREPTATTAAEAPKTTVEPASTQTEKCGLSLLSQVTALQPAATVETNKEVAIKDKVKRMLRSIRVLPTAAAKSRDANSNGGNNKSAVDMETRGDDKENTTYCSGDAILFSRMAALPHRCADTTEEQALEESIVKKVHDTTSKILQEAAASAKVSDVPLVKTTEKTETKPVATTTASHPAEKETIVTQKENNTKSESPLPAPETTTPGSNRQTRSRAFKKTTDVPSPAKKSQPKKISKPTARRSLPNRKNKPAVKHERKARSQSLAPSTAAELPKMEDLKKFYAKNRPSAVEWDERIAQCKAFLKEHGHLKIPKSNHQLGAWCGKMRVQYKHYHEMTTKEQQSFAGQQILAEIQDLDKLGFCWLATKRMPVGYARSVNKPWEYRYQQLIEYKMMHGHTNVPMPRRPYDPATNQLAVLGLWVRRQRAHWRAAKRGERSEMSKERCDQLLAIGFEFDMPTCVSRDNKPPRRTKGAAKTLVSATDQDTEEALNLEGKKPCDLKTKSGSSRRASTTTGGTKTIKKKQTKTAKKKSSLKKSKEQLVADPKSFQTKVKKAIRSIVRRQPEIPVEPDAPTSEESESDSQEEEEEMMESEPEIEQVEPPQPVVPPVNPALLQLQEKLQEMSSDDESDEEELTVRRHSSFVF